MKKITVLIMVALMFLSIPFAVSAKKASETNIIFIEAEDLTFNGYESVTKDGAFGKAIVSDAKTDTFTLKFNIAKAGTYAIWMKVFNTSQLDNSFIYKLGGVDKVFDLNEAFQTEDLTFKQYNTWYWFKVNERGTGTARHVPVNFELAAGENTIVFTAREVGAFIDSIIITDDLDYDPGKFDGNEQLPACGFCGEKHYLFDPYVKTGKTAKQLFEAALAAETSSSTTTTTTATSPVTADLTLLISAAAFAAGGVFVVGKRRKEQK